MTNPEWELLAGRFDSQTREELEHFLWDYAGLTDDGAFSFFGSIVYKRMEGETPFLDFLNGLTPPDIIDLMCEFRSFSPEVMHN